MRRSGDLVQWNDQRGFGFVRDSDGKRYFVHITAIRRADMRPQTGDRVSFDPGVGADGRPVAYGVVLMGVPLASPPAEKRVHSPPAASVRLAVAAAILLVAVTAMQLGPAPSWVLIAYLVLGIVSMGLYWADKRAAEAQRWRITENSLHFTDLVGGIAGGLVAQAILRHKVRKQGFTAITWGIALLHLGLLATLAAKVWSIPAALW